MFFFGVAFNHCDYRKDGKFNMYTVHLDTLGIIHECKWIAVIKT
jgi:hypothetical protein